MKPFTLEIRCTQSGLANEVDDRLLLNLSKHLSQDGRVDLDVVSGSVLIKPLATDTEQYFVEERHSALVLTNDPRLLCGSDARVDEHALYSLLQFGAIVPPFGPWVRCRRLVAPHKYRIDLLTARLEESSIPTTSFRVTQSRRAESVEECVSRLRGCLES